MTSSDVAAWTRRRPNTFEPPHRRLLVLRRISLVVLGVVAISGSATALSVNSIVGTARADVLHGTEGTDVMRGLAGNDTLRGRGGSDRLEGGPGNDMMFGDAGNDSLFADVRGGFSDELHGGPGNDVLVSRTAGFVRLIGGPGNDVLRGSSGITTWSADTYSGGPGDDKLLAVDITNQTDVFLPNACGTGRDLVELLRVPSSVVRADVVETLRRVSGCERVVFR